MRIFITGASGFLGRALGSALAAHGHSVIGIASRDCDLTAPGALERLPREPFDQIYHLAAWTQAGDFCLKHPGEQWIINQRINTVVLAWWKERQPQAKLICTGTSCAYDPTLELAEENYLLVTPIESLFTYAMTKRMLFAGLCALHRQFGLRYLHLVPSTLYGPGYHRDGRQMHFIFDLIRKIMRGRLFGEPVILWGDGHQRRELVYLDDFVSLAIDLADRMENETVNIGAGEEYSIRHFARLICERVGYNADSIRYDPTRYVGATSKCLDVRKLHLLVPDFRPTSLEIGIERTVEWFEDRRNDQVVSSAR